MRREEVTGPEYLDRPTPDAAEQVSERDRIQRALLRVPAGQRTILLLRFYEDRSVEDVSAILHKTTGTIKIQTSRGLATLRKALADAPHEGSDGDERLARIVRRR
jgi:RNA polymerase sigma factor (sigma-70 family)